MIASPNMPDKEASQVLINSAEGETKRSKKEVWMLCREVFVFNPEVPDKREKALVFFDVDSQKSFVDQGLAECLKLNMGLKSSLRVPVFGTKTPKEVKTSIVKLGLELKNGGRKILSLSTIDYMIKSKQVARVSESDYRSLKDCTVLDVKTVRQFPRVLIGADYFFEFFRSHYPLASGFTWVDTTFGPVLLGRGWVEQEKMSENGVYSSPDVDQLWDLDSTGIRDSPIQQDDDLAFEQFHNSLTRGATGRYSVGFPWKEKSPDLSDNKEIAFGRLKSVLDKFQGNKDILRQYDETFQEQLKL